VTTIGRIRGYFAECSKGVSEAAYPRESNYVLKRFHRNLESAERVYKTYCLLRTRPPVLVLGWDHEVTLFFVQRQRDSSGRVVRVGRHEAESARVMTGPVSDCDQHDCAAVMTGAAFLNPRRMTVRPS
jgi:hypothetical protein